MKKQLLKRLSAFMPVSMAFITMMMFCSSVNAQIVYTDVIPDTTITQSTIGSSAYKLDINNDGITDATFTANRTSSNVAILLGTSTGSGALMYYYGPLLAKSINYNAIIDSASPIGTNLLWANAQNVVLRQTPIGGGRGGMGGNPIPFGDWSNATDRYVAIRFLVGGELYYGWVRLSASGASFTIRDYAYNSKPNHLILAGDTSCTIPSVSLTASGPLSICKNDKVQFSASTNISNKYQWFKDGSAIPGGNSSSYIAFGAGAYYVNVRNSCGNISSKVDTVSVFAVDSSVSVSGGTLTANAASATYQWIDCSTMQKIPGATAQTFSPSQSGSFAVIVTQNSCSDTSTCYAIISAAIHENIFASSISLYPNPSSNQLTIDLGSIKQKVGVTFTDITGKVTYSTIVSDSQKIEVSTQEFKAGIYFVQIQSDDFTITKKLVVER